MDKELSFIVVSCISDMRFQRKLGNEFYCLLNESAVCPYKSGIYLQVPTRVDNYKFNSICKRDEERK